MARSLRPRKERPSYASMVDSGDEGAPEEDGASSDDFQPPSTQGEVDDAMDVSDAQASQVSEVPPSKARPSITKIAQPRKKSGKGTLKKEPSVSVSLPRTVAGPSTSRPQYAASVAGIDHRQRAGPLYLVQARVERLADPPSPFKAAVTVPTNAWNLSKSIAERTTRAHSYNTGQGPIWELLEDRSWWKESHAVGEGMTETEASRRPRVYESVKVIPPESIREEYVPRLLHRDASHFPVREARKYLPSDAPIKCYFGPPSNSVMKELNLFDSFETSESRCSTSLHSR